MMPFGGYGLGSQKPQPQQQQQPGSGDEPFDHFILALVETSILMEADFKVMLPVILGTIARVKGEAAAEQWRDRLVALIRNGENKRQAKAEDVQRLKREMMAAHPDRGGPGGVVFDNAHAAWKQAEAELRAQGGKP